MMLDLACSGGNSGGVKFRDPTASRDVSIERPLDKRFGLGTLVERLLDTSSIV